MIANYGNHPVRNAPLPVARLRGACTSGHSVITGKAPPGATLKITKDFTLYTNPVLQPTRRRRRPRRRCRSRRTSSPRCVVPASGKFTWDVNPSVRPVPPYRAEGRVGGPNGYLTRSPGRSPARPPTARCWRPTRSRSTRARRVNMSLCTQGGVGRHGPGDAGADARHAGDVRRVHAGLAKDYTASTTATVISTAGDATLSVADPSPTATGHLVNGTFSLPSAAAGRGRLRPRSRRSAARPLRRAAHLLRPGVQRPVTVNFKQAIGASDALRTGTLLEDADLHAVDHDAVAVRGPRP